MAETPLKRQREETEETHVDGPAEDQTKRLKPSSSSYPHNILSFLDDQLDDGQISSQDLSSLISALQDELASESEPNIPSEPELASPSSSSPGEESDGDEDKEKVFRHLLVASDDELGLPSREGEGPEAGASGVELLSCDGLWELEDEAANYYTLLQSELFMWGEFAK
ncbi:uncharacterized protein LOC115726496 [Rhodamnia argentea]|uniref:Uncharacterized protein LOC115726496 n=1 Tax=Rhodamnia argentea TaxID=178133 RepID=A0ABM3HIC5_9MYRT|nr:uncharacterized protein LOC115726496 [Rhodamnia argentea]